MPAGGASLYWRSSCGTSANARLTSQAISATDRPMPMANRATIHDMLEWLMGVMELSWSGSWRPSCSHVDGDDFSDDVDAEHFEDADDHERSPSDAGVPQQAHGVGLHLVEHEHEHDGQQADHPGLQLALGREGADLSFHLQTAADGVGGSLQRFGQAAAGLGGDAHGRQHEGGSLRGDSPVQVAQA